MAASVSSLKTPADARRAAFDADDLINTLMRDGFVVFRGFFPKDVAEQARVELKEWHARDIEARTRAGVDKNDSQHYHQFESAAGESSLSRYSHVLVDVYGKSPTLDHMFETVLTDPVSSKVIRAIAGEYFKIRGYNSRLMTGKPDELGQGWHRDSPGEFGIGFLLTDVPPGDNGATAVLPGSHLLPYDPQANCLFRDDGWHVTTPVSNRLKKLAIFNRLLEKKLMPRATGVSGTQGDLYIFLNDTWHGRQPNIHGRETMVVLIGCYPTEFPFPEEVKSLPAEVVVKLPPAVREVVRLDRPPNEKKDTVIYMTLSRREPLQRFGLFYWAAIERQLLVAGARREFLKLLRGWTGRAMGRIAG